MMMTAALVLGAALWVGACGAGPLPALGNLLDPVHGVWSVARNAELPADHTVRLPSLDGDVRVLYDGRGVPHIFAESELDLYRALGYVLARDRLFQLEIQTRATAGRLTELVGPRALPADRQMRRLGLAWAAERAWGELEPPVRAILEAYAEGVNARMDELRGRRDYPVEYHLLEAEPLRWRPEYSLYLGARMGWTLAYNDDARRRERLVELVGHAAADALMPRNNPIQEPIIPGGGLYPRFDPVRVPAPAGRTAVRPLPPAPSHAGINASNSWAVSPSRSVTGHALLAGDPHLGLSLPSIWYEVHLVVPGALDVYGVTFAGGPGVAIGFNRDAAWSFTNTGADVLDLYEETLDDPDEPRRYRLDGEWRDLDVRIETYRDQSGRVIAVDTIFHTHRGPLMLDGERPRSFRWTVLEDLNALDVLRRGQSAGGVSDWLNVMSGFRSPAQNLAVADRSGSIAIRSSGRFPVRPGNGSGVEIRDGSSSASDWRSHWRSAREPAAINPRQGFVASANQQPVDPRREPGYLGINWVSPWRAMRINQLLRENSAVTVDAMRRYQTDPGSARADWFVPYLLEAVEAVSVETSARDGEPRIDAATLRRARQAASLLAGWDRRYTMENEFAVLFEYTMQRIADRLWDELVPPGEENRIHTPADAVLASLLRDPANSWWDDRRTEDVVEDRDLILVLSLADALDRAERLHGDRSAGAWRWSGIRHANIRHLLGISAFSALRVPVQGGPGLLNPSSGDGTHGASWRMVVELGPEVRGYGTYPGGQSGNPVSTRYLDRLDTWIAGELDPLIFPRTPQELDDSEVTARLTFTRGGR